MKQIPTYKVILLSFLIIISCGTKSPTKEKNTADSASIKGKLEVQDSSGNTQDNAKMVNVYLKVVMLEKIENQDSRIGTDSKSVVELWVGNTKIDSYEEYGDGDIFNNGLQANVNSEMSEKIYIVNILDSKCFNVKATLLFEGEEEYLWTKTYSLQRITEWKITHCDGQCN